MSVVICCKGEIFAQRIVGREGYLYGLVATGGLREFCLYVAVDGDDGFYPKFDDVIGVYHGKRIKGVGVLIMFFQSYIGIITSISVVYTMIYISVFNRKLEDALYDREEMLEAHFDIDSMDENSYLELEQTTNQKIYYHGEAYVFSSDGFIEKHLMNDEEKKDFEKLQEITNSQNDKKKKNNKTKVKEDLTDGKK